MYVCVLYVDMCTHDHLPENNVLAAAAAVMLCRDDGSRER